MARRRYFPDMMYRPFLVLMAATLVATACILPAMWSLLDPARPSPFVDGSVDRVQFLTGFAVANIVASAVAIAIALRLEPSVGMGVPRLRSWLAGEVVELRPVLVRCFAIAIGLAALVLASAFAFRSQLPGLPEGFVFPPVWAGLLMMLGAAVREEILFRFFAMNLVVWIAIKVLRKQAPMPSLVWAANVCVALLFAVMHLVPAAQLLALSTMASAGAITLGTIAGVVLGWVYWRHGLMMAMFTHAVSGSALYLGARGIMAVAG